MADLRSINNEDVDSEIAREEPTLIKFFTDGCPACARFAPTFAQLAEEYAGRAVLVQMEARKNMDTSKKLAVRGVPTVVVFQAGKEVQRLTGAKTLQEMRDWLKPVLP
jgi:thioredoxin-like negative regulator of GroEL